MGFVWPKDQASIRLIATQLITGCWAIIFANEGLEKTCGTASIESNSTQLDNFVCHLEKFLERPEDFSKSNHPEIVFGRYHQEAPPIALEYILRVNAPDNIQIRIRTNPARHIEYRKVCWRKQLPRDTRVFEMTKPGREIDLSLNINVVLGSSPLINQTA